MTCACPTPTVDQLVADLTQARPAAFAKALDTLKKCSPSPLSGEGILENLRALDETVNLLFKHRITQSIAAKDAAATYEFFKVGQDYYGSEDSPVSRNFHFHTLHADAQTLFIPALMYAEGEYSKASDRLRAYDFYSHIPADKTSIIQLGLSLVNPLTAEGNFSTAAQWLAKAANFYKESDPKLAAQYQQRSKNLSAAGKIVAPKPFGKLEILQINEKLRAALAPSVQTPTPAQS